MFTYSFWVKNSSKLNFIKKNYEKMAYLKKKRFLNIFMIEYDRSYVNTSAPDPSTVHGIEMVLN